MRRAGINADPRQIRAWQQRSRARQRERALVAPKASGFRKRKKIPKEMRQIAFARSGGLCIVCAYELSNAGPRRMSAMRATQIHHVLAVNPWREFELVVDNLVGVCARHHARHENASCRIPRGALPACALALAAEHGLGWFIDRVYPA